MLKKLIEWMAKGFAKCLKIEYSRKCLLSKEDATIIREKKVEERDTSFVRKKYPLLVSSHHHHQSC